MVDGKLKLVKLSSRLDGIFTSASVIRIFNCATWRTRELVSESLNHDASLGYVFTCSRLELRAHSTSPPTRRLKFTLQQFFASQDQCLHAFASYTFQPLRIGFFRSARAIKRFVYFSRSQSDRSQREHRCRDFSASRA